MNVPVVEEPSSKRELLRELRALHESSTEFWDSFPASDFFAPLGDAWSPADNVRHLIKSNRPVARALRLPRIALLARFGIALRRSRTFAEVRDTYRAALARGVTAGRFAPAPEPAPADPDAARRALMKKRAEIAADLESAVEAWGERALGRFRLPHPALGMLTVREMLFFTLYHNLHHVNNVARRMGDRPAA
jgi:hypothetical protein